MHPVFRWSAPVLGLGLLALPAAGCGGDDDGPPPAKPAAAAGRTTTTARKGNTATDKLQVYRRIEDRAADDKERASLRYAFRDNDFAFDPTGTVNRDPFRSFVISQPGVSTGETAITVEPTELCPSKRQIASSYGARELKLIGIVARGTDRWALFSDTAQKGHIVHRNDCIGKEKGRVVEIGATYAKAEISPEPVANQPPRPAEVVLFELHPRQLPLGEDLEEMTGNDQPTSTGRTGPAPSSGGGNQL